MVNHSNHTKITVQTKERPCFDAGAFFSALVGLCLWRDGVLVWEEDPDAVADLN